MFIVQQTAVFVNTYFPQKHSLVLSSRISEHIFSSFQGLERFKCIFPISTPFFSPLFTRWANTLVVYLEYTIIFCFYERMFLQSEPKCFCADVCPDWTLFHRTTPCPRFPFRTHFIWRVSAAWPDQVSSPSDPVKPRRKPWRYKHTWMCPKTTPELQFTANLQARL